MFKILNRFWIRLSNKQKIFIEISGSAAVFLIFLAIYNLLIPSDLRAANEFINIIGIAGFIVGFWGFIKSWQAATKSEQIQERLIETGILSTDIKGNFGDIFKEHLLHKLITLQNVKGNIYLSLSTPAYGYSVLGKEESYKLFHAFRNLHGDCKIQLILFTPDAHFKYWANTIFWAINGRGLDRQKDLLENFASYTKLIMDLLSSKNCQLWLKNETTVRFFAYEYYNKEIHQDVKKAYISLVDSFAIYQNQFQEDFRARSIPIQLLQMDEFFNSELSFFDKLKICPYTLKTKDQAALKFGDIGDARDQSIAEQLAWDYILGRTSIKYYYNIDKFKEECNSYVVNLKTLDTSKRSLSKESILKDVLLVYFEYITFLDVNYHIVRDNIISTIQLKRLTTVLKKITLKEFENIQTHFSIIPVKKKEEVFEELLFDVITSGAEESTSVPAIRLRT